MPIKLQFWAGSFGCKTERATQLSSAEEYSPKYLMEPEGKSGRTARTRRS